jgi:hypothetical protein
MGLQKEKCSLLSVGSCVGGIKYWLSYFHTYQVETTAKLTDYFLATLLAKKLIGVADAEL